MLKSVLILSFAILAFSNSFLELNSPLDHENLAKYINSVQTQWVAGVNSRFENKSMSDIKKLLGALKTPKEKRLPVKKLLTAVNIPASFDSREAWPSCTSLKEVRDQSTCGSCWAFGAAEAMSDRICIASGQTRQDRISTEDLLSCCDSCGNGCDGGYPSAAWDYFAKTGLVTGGLYGDTNWCKPYSMPPCDHHVSGKYGPCSGESPTPQCVYTCQSSYPKAYHDDLHFASNSYSVNSNEADIQTEIMTHGPVEAAFQVYEDFPTYKSGVYQHTTGGFLGGHAIKIIGWGVENNSPYWLVVNSWNEGWGDHGTFKIKRGSDECGIEDEVVAGVPKL